MNIRQALYKTIEQKINRDIYLDNEGGYVHLFSFNGNFSATVYLMVLIVDEGKTANISFNISSNCSSNRKQSARIIYNGDIEFDDSARIGFFDHIDGNNIDYYIDISDMYGDFENYKLMASRIDIHYGFIKDIDVYIDEENEVRQINEAIARTDIFSNKISTDAIFLHGDTNYVDIDKNGLYFHNSVFNSEDDHNADIVLGLYKSGSLFVKKDITMGSDLTKGIIEYSGDLASGKGIINISIDDTSIFKSSKVLDPDKDSYTENTLLGFPTGEQLIAGTTIKSAGNTYRYVSILEDLFVSNLYISNNFDKKNNKLEISNNGNIKCSSLSCTSITIRDGGNIKLESDRRLKNNITPVHNNLLDGVLATEISTFNYKAQPDKDKVLGVIAQDLEKNFPDLINQLILVEESDEIQGKMTIYETKLIYVLWKALQEEAQKRQELENKINRLFDLLEDRNHDI